MKTSAGWYPDPGGQPGMYRYWDGTSWSETLSASPAAPPPTNGPTAEGPPSTGAPTPGFGANLGGSPETPRRTGAIAWILVAVVGVIALVVVAAFVVPRLGNMGRPGADPLPGGQGSIDPCPPQPTARETPQPQPNDGRIHGGPISYPRLGDPWGAPHGDTRVPFGRDVVQQTVPVEENYDGPNDWVASILIAELMAGDGFFSPEEGSAIVARCVVGRFYGDAVVTRDDKVNEAITIDGHEAWIIESQLSFDIEGLETKGELMIIAVIKVDDFKSGLYYASIPDTVPELVEPARTTLQQVKVDA